MQNRYQPDRNPVSPITVRYRFKQNADWEDISDWILFLHKGAFVLYNFREYVSERKMIRLLHGFLVDHQLLNEITKDVIIWYFSFEF